MATKKIIAFSGGCNSGKTTTIFEAKKVLEERGKKVLVLQELLRDITQLPIDELRRKPQLYLDIQDTIIRKKIAQENKIKQSNADIVLIDRAITDSLFYLTFYLDKSKFTYAQFDKFDELYRDTDLHATKAFTKLYNHVVLFAPFNFIACADKYRPRQVLRLSKIEYDLISALNYSYESFDGQIIEVNRQKNLNTTHKILELCE